MQADDLYQRKWARLRDQMRSAGVTALVLSENGRTRYVSGYQRYYTGTYLPFVHAVVMTMDAGPVLLLPRHILRSAEECVAERFVEFPLDQEGKIETLAGLLETLGVARGRIAVEFNFVPYGHCISLLRRLREAEIVDAAPLVNRVTAVKFPEEVQVIREAAHMVEFGITAAVEASREGATELGVAAHASAAMLYAGAEFINHMCVRSGPHAVGLFPVPTPRVLRQGDCVQIDIGCIHRGYVSDINRTVVVGTPTDEQRALMRVGQEMLERGIAAVRPGATGARVWRASFEVAERVGMAERVTIPFSGHGIGLGLHEEPYIGPNSLTVLKENMVFALEPGVYAPGVGGSRPEDMLVVTAAGCEVMTHFPRDYDLLQAP
jgi:Xaa-Pro aminopeptidase